MTEISFLSRKTLGQPNYILIAMAIAFVVAFVPRGVRLAVESGTSRAEDWLPADSVEVAALTWFHEQFPAAQAASGSEFALSDLLTVAGLAALVSVVVGYASLRSLSLVGIVLIVATLCAGTSLAIVYYFGVCEMALLDLSAPRFGVVDQLLMLMPVVVYSATVCVTLFLVNRYCQIRRANGPGRAAEAAVRTSWGPCVLATLAMVAALAPLWVSEILALQRFGLFTAAGLFAALAFELALLPVLLHCFPGDEQHRAVADGGGLTRVLVNHPVATCLLLLSAIGASAVGFGRMGTATAQRPVSLEVVLTAPTRHHRTAEESAEHDGRRYRMTLAERQALAREVEDRLAGVPGISGSNSARGEGDKDFCRTESGKARSRRELWRVAAQVATGTDCGQFMEGLKAAIDPIPLAYQQRDRIVNRLHEAGKQLGGSQLCLLYRTPVEQASAPLGAQEAVLANLLQRSGLAPKSNPDGTTMKALSSFNLAQLDAQADDPQYLEAAIKALGEQDALILVSAGSDPTARQFAEAGVTVIDVSQMPALEPAEEISVVFTGDAPLLAEAQRQAPLALKRSVLWSVLLVAGVLVLGSAVPLGWPATAQAAIRDEDLGEVEEEAAISAAAECAPASMIEYEAELVMPEQEEPAAVPARRFDVSESEKAELQSGPHGALHAKLRSLRRELPQGGVSP